MNVKRTHKDTWSSSVRAKVKPRFNSFATQSELSFSSYCYYTCVNNSGDLFYRGLFGFQLLAPSLCYGVSIVRQTPSPWSNQVIRQSQITAGGSGVECEFGNGNAVRRAAGRLRMLNALAFGVSWLSVMRLLLRHFLVLCRDAIQLDLKVLLIPDLLSLLRTLAMHQLIKANTVLQQIVNAAHHAEYAK